MGLMGKRDTKNKLPDLPIPTSNSADARHDALAHLGRDAREKAGKCLKLAGKATSLSRPRGWIREQIGNERDDIGRIVKKLL